MNPPTRVALGACLPRRVGRWTASATCSQGLIPAPPQRGPAGAPAGGVGNHPMPPLRPRQPVQHLARERPTHREAIGRLGDTLGDTQRPFVSPRGRLRPQEQERPREANPARALDYRRFQAGAAEDVNRLGKVMLYRAELLPRTRAAGTLSGWGESVKATPFPTVERRRAVAAHASQRPGVTQA